MKRLLAIAAFFTLAAGPAFAHVGHGATTSFAAGLSHPLAGVDHVAAMVMVGLWAALKGGRALWIWPAVFIGVMLFGIPDEKDEQGSGAWDEEGAVQLAVRAMQPIWAHQSQYQG